MLAIRVLNGFGGEAACDVELDSEATVAGVKVQIRHNLGVPVCDQILLHEGQVLQDDSRLEHVAACAGVTRGNLLEFTLAHMPQSFEDFGLKESLLRGIYSYGFETPSKLQKELIMPFVGGRDLVVQAKAGTGKTAAFVVGTLQRIDSSITATQALVLAPTRELACPIQKVAFALGEHMRTTSAVCIGGASIRDTIERLRQDPHVVVGTPGSVKSMIDRRIIRLDDLKTFVIDEADEVMSRGFQGLIRETMELLPPHIQLTVFSATMPADVLEHFKSVMRDPMQISVTGEKDEFTLGGVRHFYIAVEREEWKRDVLVDLFGEIVPPSHTAIFCNTRRKADFVADFLTKQGIVASSLDIDSGTISGIPPVVVTTDMMSRLIDTEVRLVVNYDMPSQIDFYPSRVSGRRVAVSLVTNADVAFLREVQNHHQVCIEEMPVDIADLI